MKSSEMMGYFRSWIVSHIINYLKLYNTEYLSLLGILHLHVLFNLILKTAIWGMY